MNILAFAASSSLQSINKQLVSYASTLINNVDIEILDLNDYELPLFSEDKEKELGQPELAKQFYEKIGQADALLISFAEHNGSYTAAYKNLFDWTSRIDTKVFQNKPTVLLSTSPGAGGARNVLAAAKTSAPYFGGNVKADLSVANFYENFSVEEQKISNLEIQAQLKKTLSALI